MARAAAGLARVCALLLGGVYGSRVLLLVGAGNNGGDALYAGAALAAAAPGSTRCCWRDRVHEAGLAALRAGRRPPSSTTHGAVGASTWCVDGILGIGGRGGLRGRAADVVAGCPTARRWWPSTSRAASTRPPARSPERR